MVRRSSISWLRARVGGSVGLEGALVAQSVREKGLELGIDGVDGRLVPGSVRGHQVLHGRVDLGQKPLVRGELSHQARKR